MPIVWPMDHRPVLLTSIRPMCLDVTVHAVCSICLFGSIVSINGANYDLQSATILMQSAVVEKIILLLGPQKFNQQLF